jgi:ABC-type uncharacterized transport system fused permease/ATPase subunit
VEADPAVLDLNRPGFRGGVGCMIAFMLVFALFPSYSEWLQHLIRVRWGRWFTDHYIARWRANIESLTRFSDSMDIAQRAFESGGIASVRAEAGRIQLADRQVEAPRGQVLLGPLNATLHRDEREAIAGG